jgi:hypothetical protein
MLKAVCGVVIRICPDEARKGTNIVVKQLEIHDTESRVRVLPDIAAEEDGNASLDQLDNSGLQVVNLGVHV